MHTILTNFATAEATGHAAEEASGNVLDSLGIDPKLFVFQLIAFLLLLWLLNKYVFPVLMKAVDERQKTIDESLQAAHDAEKQAAEAEAKIEAMLKKARGEAADIVTTAKDEAGALVTKAEERSKAQAQRIVDDAQSTIAKEVIAARKALHNETIELVAQATEKVVGKTLDGKIDNKLIEASLNHSGDKA
ncbi:F0F1 ATP synthase subunit B [Candidatus Saccharibacteria bacterium]|jgi:F-type H+-transporting ATPase subunit b|nr:F0F1 ATP synthase subunit B [Candidatus Saccharibacteria bacterium]